MQLLGAGVCGSCSKGSPGCRQPKSPLGRKTFYVLGDSPCPADTPATVAVFRQQTQHPTPMLWASRATEDNGPARAGGTLTALRAPGADSLGGSQRANKGPPQPFILTGGQGGFRLLVVGVYSHRHMGGRGCSFLFLQVKNLPSASRPSIQPCSLTLPPSTPLLLRGPDKGPSQAPLFPVCHPPLTVNLP